MTAQAQLVRLLQMAYSAELAAAYAYRGHWNSVSDKDERERIHQIEDEELHHRRLVGDMLAKLNAGPKRSRELRASLIGKTLGYLCHVTGWLAPMYGAGRLESRNIREYETAARYARSANHEQFVDCLLTMAEVEWEHEKYFRSRVLVHRFAAFVPLWPAPLPKESIRASFANSMPETDGIERVEAPLRPVIISQHTSNPADRYPRFRHAIHHESGTSSPR
ncbi:MAG TPA: ferritin-like domain-containing protein [Pyrinomonadaceae bacterium]|nr:ferritin-like domain-containing protein [Pyrinomonadaceae bacterium]